MQIIKSILAFTILIPLFSFGRVDTFRTRVQIAARHALYDSNFDHIRIWIDPQKESLLRDAFNKAVSLKKYGDTATALAEEYFIMKAVAEQNGFINSLEYSSVSMDIEEAFITNSLKKLNSRVPVADQPELERKFRALSAKTEFQPGDLKAGRQFAEDYNELIRFIVSDKHNTSPSDDKEIKDDNVLSSQPIAFTVLAILIGVIFLLHFIIVHHQRKKKKVVPTRPRHTIH